MNKFFNKPIDYRNMSNYQLNNIIINNLGKSENEAMFMRYYFPNIKRVFEFILDNLNRLEDFFENLRFPILKNLKPYENKVVLKYISNTCIHHIVFNKHIIDYIMYSFDADLIVKIFKLLNVDINSLELDMCSILDKYYIYMNKKNIPLSKKFIYSMLYISDKETVNIVRKRLFHFILNDTGYEINELDEYLLEYFSNNNSFDINQTILKIKATLTHRNCEILIYYITKYFKDKLNITDYLIFILLYTINTEIIKKYLNIFEPSYKIKLQAFYLFINYLKQVSYRPYYAREEKITFETINIIFNLCNIDIHDYSDDKYNTVFELMNYFKNSVADNHSVGSYDYYSDEDRFIKTLVRNVSSSDDDEEE